MLSTSFKPNLNKPPQSASSSHTELYRHGDVFIQRVDALPATAKASHTKSAVLIRGEATGHSHRIAEANACKLYFHQHQRQGTYQFDQYLEVTAPSVHLVHEEHNTIELSQGVYRYWRQREYAPEGNYWVRD